MTGAKPFLLAALAGLAGALGHAPFGLWPVALAGFSGLIYLVSVAARPTLVGWVGGALYFGVTLHWIVEPFFVDIQRHGWLAPFALVGLGGGLALFWAAAGWLSKHMGAPRALTFALALAGSEVLRGHILTGFPWALPGYIWVETPWRLSVAWIGSYGLTFATLLIASLPAVLPRWWQGTGAATAALAVLAVPGLSTPSQPVEPAALGTARIIQPNIPQNQKWDRDLAPDLFQRKLDLTRGVESAGPADVAIWPETALVVPLDAAESALVSIGQAAGTEFITGLNRRDADGWYNSLVVSGADGSVKDSFDKVHLVPFGEYIPLGLPILRRLAGTTSNGFTAGSEVRLIETALGKALPLICYEGIFPGHPFKAGERADYILILTNDAWFGTFAGPKQHLDQARFRAAEQGLPVIRVANKGISAVIDPYGNLDAASVLAADMAGTVDAQVPVGLQSTPYARFGDTPLFAVLTVIIIASLILGRRKRVAHRPGVE